MTEPNLAGLRRQGSFELSGTFDGGFSASFTTPGPLTRTVYARRFWLLWSVNRYLRRLKAERS